MINSKTVDTKKEAINIALGSKIVSPAAFYRIKQQIK
jgi:hypothetical protein